MGLDRRSTVTLIIPPALLALAFAATFAYAHFVGARVASNVLLLAYPLSVILSLIFVVTVAKDVITRPPLRTLGTFLLLALGALPLISAMALLTLMVIHLP